jgi:hypothetical protein
MTNFNPLRLVILAGVVASAAGANQRLRSQTYLVSNAEESEQASRPELQEDGLFSNFFSEVEDWQLDRGLMSSSMMYEAYSVSSYKDSKSSKSSKSSKDSKSSKGSKS